MGTNSWEDTAFGSSPDSSKTLLDDRCVQKSKTRKELLEVKCLIVGVQIFYVPAQRRIYFDVVIVAHRFVCANKACTGRFAWDYNVFNSVLHN